MESWIASGLDMIHTYFLKKLTSVHERSTQMNQLLVATSHPDIFSQSKSTIPLVLRSSKLPNLSPYAGLIEVFAYRSVDRGCPISNERTNIVEIHFQL